ncbi:GbsR/MarR family transcriptional regulator [Aliikangiella coralliicola]|uniref:HTH-type transcriptional regulator n=1 Tax=Aliikangiella coralliicola TaxID=2592383 RepID=A0A545U7C3_9GAMM|nr:MarR family transcriptional regulator [Aliikangiella coralliicola]TQV85369.1 transcriptional regulator [Aliikangiella coralliicola]
MELPSELETFVVHFGEMGSRWGFNRTVGQMLAVIVFTEEALNADQIAKMLSISRGNVSMGIKELQSWQLIRVHHKPGDRKDYFKPAGTIWELALQVLSERRKREVDPTLSLLRGQLMNEPGEYQFATERVKEIHDLLELFNTWFEDIHRMNPDSLKTLLKLGSGVGKVLDLKERLTTRDKS